MISKIKQQQKHFNSVSMKYYNSRKSKRHLLYKKLLWEYFFIDKKLFDRTKEIHVLEPMCGYGEGKEIIEKNFSNKVIYEGFDYDDKLVKIAKRKYPQSIIYKLDVIKFKPKKKYDVVIIIGGLHHVFDYVNQIVKTVYNSLKPNGYFVSLEPTQNNFLFKKVRQIIYKKNPFFDENTEKAFDLNYLNTLFLKNRFSIIDQSYPGLASYILYYNPDVFPHLHIGGNLAVKSFFRFEKLFFRNIIGKKMSFATLSLLQKKNNE